LDGPLVDPLQLKLSNSAARSCRTSHLRGHAPIDYLRQFLPSRFSE